MAINGSSVNRVAINAEDTITLTPTLSATSTSTSTISKLLSIFKTLSVTSTSISTFIKAIGKALSTVNEMSIVVLTESAFHLILLSITESTVISLKKAISVTKSVTSVSTVSFVRSIARILSVVSVSTVTLLHGINKLLSVISVTSSSFVRGIAITIKATSVTIASLFIAFLPKLGAVVRYTFTANMRDSLIQLFKQRNVRANESNKKVQK